MVKLFPSIPARTLAGAIAISFASGWLVATVAGDSVVPGTEYSFGLHAGVWEASPNGNWGHSALAYTQLGEPAFLRVALVTHGLPTKVGLDGPTFAESSLEVRVKRGGAFGWTWKDWEWEKAVAARPEDATPKPAGMMDMPPGDMPRNNRSVSLVLWFHDEAGEDGDPDQAAGDGPPAAGGPRRLLFDRPGLYPVLARVPRLLIPYGPGGKPEWMWRAANDEAAVQVGEPDPQVKAFAADVAAVIPADLVMPPAQRAMLEKHAAADPEHRVARWAEWLLLRSYVADPAWRAGLAKRDPDALAAFAKHEPAARQFLAELKWIETPPWYEAKLFLAAGLAAESAAHAKLAQPGVDEVIGEYVGARAVWDAGKPPAAGAAGDTAEEAPTVQPRLRIIRSDADAPTAAPVKP